jgi:hypothetical protein
MEVSDMDAQTISAIGGATAAGFTAITAVYRRLTTKLDDCESKHAATNAELLIVSTRMASVEGRMEGFEEGKAKEKAKAKQISETETA